MNERLVAWRVTTGNIQTFRIMTVAVEVEELYLDMKDLHFLLHLSNISALSRW